MCLLTHRSRILYANNLARSFVNYNRLNVIEVPIQRPGLNFERILNCARIVENWPEKVGRATIRLFCGSSN